MKVSHSHHIIRDKNIMEEEDFAHTSSPKIFMTTITSSDHSSSIIILKNNKDNDTNYLYIKYIVGDKV